LQLLVYETVNNNLSPKPGEHSKMPIPASLIAGACAEVCSTISTLSKWYPKESKPLRFKSSNLITILLKFSYVTTAGTINFEYYLKQF